MRATIQCFFLRHELATFFGNVSAHRLKEMLLGHSVNVAEASPNTSDGTDIVSLWQTDAS